MKATIKKRLELLERTILEREDKESHEDIIKLWLDFIICVIENPKIENLLPNIANFKDFSLNQRAREEVRKIIGEHKQK